MSETDTEIAWRATVEDARAYMRGEIASPEPGTLAGEIHEFCNKKTRDSYARGAGVEAARQAQRLQKEWEMWQQKYAELEAKHRANARMATDWQWIERERQEPPREATTLKYVICGVVGGIASGVLAWAVFIW